MIKIPQVAGPKVKVVKSYRSLVCEGNAESKRSSKTSTLKASFDPWIKENRMLVPAVLKSAPPFTDLSTNSNEGHNISTNADAYTSQAQRDSQSDAGQARWRWSEFKHWINSVNKDEWIDGLRGAILQYDLFLEIKNEMAGVGGLCHTKVSNLSKTETEKRIAPLGERWEYSNDKQILEDQEIN